MCMCNSVAKDEMFDWSKLETFADDKISETEIKICVEND